MIRSIEQWLNRFIWNGKIEGPARAKVAWEEVFQKNEGGLGLRRLGEWNSAAVLRHVWALFAKSGSIWVAWVKLHLIKGRCFWRLNIPQDCSWCWRKFLIA